jgi:hypothetical protein
MPPKGSTRDSRPSPREIINKVRDALAAIEAGRREIPLVKHLSLELPGLLIESREDLWSELPGLLREIQTCGPVDCYVGRFPPEPSYEPEILNKELWAYRWPSLKLGYDVYLKFVIIPDRKGAPVYFHVDVHQDEPGKGKRR